MPPPPSPTPPLIHIYILAAEVKRRIRDRKEFADTQIRRWARLMGKMLVISMENVLGSIINAHPFMRKVCAVAFKQGLAHLAEMPWGTQYGTPTPRLLVYVGQQNEHD